MKKNLRTRIGSFFLCTVMLAGQIPYTAAAANAEKDSVVYEDGLCEHHTEHDEDCGYTEGSPCTHVHTDECYTMVEKCTHVHTDACYPDLEEDEDEEEVATPSDAKKKRGEPTECEHMCSEETGCITKKLDCQHEHDEECGYVKGTPCSYVCEICQEDTELTEEQPTTGKPTEATPSDAVSAIGAAGTVSGNTIQKTEATEKTITAWSWADSADELEIQQDEETGAWGLGMPGATINQADFDIVVSMLPTAITATVTVTGDSIESEELREQDSEEITDTEDETDYEEIEELSLTWNCDTYTKDEAGNWPISGDYTFMADLPEGYVLAKDKEKLEVIVQLGEAAPYDGNNAGFYNVTGGVSGVDWVYDILGGVDGTLTIQSSGDYTVTGDGQQTNEKIIVEENLDVKLTVKDVCCYVYRGEARKSALNISGNSNVSLILEGKNEFYGHSAAGIGFGNALENCFLTIDGDGELMAYGDYLGAGIGGSDEQTGSNITINGGTVTAMGGSECAGIGGGYSGEGSNITINGGTVTAMGASGGAGIGGAHKKNGSNITINGGTVTATSSSRNEFSGGAGIGEGGNGGSSSNIIISNGSVKASSIGTTPKNADGKELYLFKLYSVLEIDSISVDGNTWTREGSHPDNDGGFYLYLTGENHDIIADSKTYKAIWNAGTLSFDNQNAPAPTISETSSTLTTITVKVSEYNSDYGNLQYACIETGSTLKRSDWVDSTDTSYTFNDCLSGTSYTCYVRYAGNETYYTSDSVSKERRTIPAAPDPSVFTINYASEYGSYDSNIYEFNTSRDFSGKAENPNWLSPYISDADGTDQKLYVRVKEVWSGGYNTPASEATEITIPKRPQTPEAQVTATANSVTLTQNDAWEYSTDWGDYKNWNSTNEFTGMGQNQIKTCYVRVKATEYSFASAIQTVDATTSAADYTISIPPTVKAGSEAVNIAVNTDEKFDLGNNGHVDVKAVSNASFTGGILTMKYTGNEENIPNITSQMKVKDSLFTDLSKNIASFRTKDDAAVKIEFEKPKPTQGSIIRAGEYSGTVTFTVEYREGQ